MRRNQSALAALILMAQFLAPACASAHYSFESAFENPASLIYMSDEQVVYAGTTLGNTSHLLAYAEYDPFAPGYGALAVRVGSSMPGRFVGGGLSEPGDTTTWSYIAAKSIGSVGIGLAVNKTTGAADDWTIDAGVTLDWHWLTFGFAFQRLLLGPKGLASPGDTISTVGLSIYDNLAFELGAAVGPNPVYRISVDTGLGAVSARLYAMGGQDALMDPGIEVGVRAGVFTLRLGYQLDQQSSGQTARLGVSCSF